MMRLKRAVTYAVLAALLVSLAWGLTTLAVYVSNQAKAKTTVTTMVKLASVIETAKPATSSEAALRRAIAKLEVRSVGLDDGWGNRLDVSIVDEADEYSYTVRSFGRDGRRGGCCQRSVGRDWDADAVFADGEWLQSWGVP